MRPVYPALLAFIASLGFAIAAETSDSAAPTPRPGSFMPTKVEGLSNDDMAKIRKALAKASQDENFIAARQKLQDLRKQLEFASDDEKKGMRNEFETGFEKLHTALATALIKADSSITKDQADKFADALEDKIRNQKKPTAAATASAKTSTETPKTPTEPTKRDPSATKQAANPMANRGPITIPDVEGVSAEDMAKYRVAVRKAFFDADVVAARQKLQDLNQRTQFYSAREKIDMQSEFETAIEAVRQKTRSAIAKNDSTLSPEVITKVSEALEAQLKQRK